MIDVGISFFQLVFDNYTAAAGPSDASPSTSHSRRIHVNDFVGDSSCAELSQELIQLRHQLQSMKRQVVVIMDQSRKSSDRERVAVQQAQEALQLKDSAATEALRATNREEYMLDLLTDVSLDMAGKLYLFILFLLRSLYVFFMSHCLLYHS
jgi:hypothetical protein